MYTRYDYSTTANIAEVTLDVCKIINGETNKNNLSTSCVKGATSIISTEPSGWEYVTGSCEGQIASLSSAGGTFAESTTQNKFFRSNPTAGNVTVYKYLNYYMQTADATITTSANPTQMAINNVTNRLYVMCTTAVTVINTVDNTVVATISLPLTTQGIAINTVTNRIYVGDSTGVNVIDGSNNSVSKTILNISVGANGRMAVNESTGFIYWTTGSTVRKYNMSNNTVSTVYTGASTLYDVAIDATNNIYYVCGGFTEGARIWGFDGATDTRQASAFVTTSGAQTKIEVFSSANTRVLMAGWSDVKVYDLDSKTLIRTFSAGGNSVNANAVSKFADSAVFTVNGGTGAYRIDAVQGNRPLQLGMPFNYFRSLNADGLTYKYMAIIFYGTTTPSVGMHCLEPYSNTARSITGVTSGTTSTSVSASLGGTLFIGSSNRYAFLSGWINGNFQAKIGIVERTRDSAWDTPAYGVQPVVHLTIDSLGTGNHYAPRVKTLAGADSLNQAYITTSLFKHNDDAAVLIPDANFVSKNPVIYLNFINRTRGDLGGRSLGLPITTYGLGTNLDEIIYNGNTYVMFECGSSGNRLMVPKF